MRSAVRRSNSSCRLKYSSARHSLNSGCPPLPDGPMFGLRGRSAALAEAALGSALDAVAWLAASTQTRPALCTDLLGA